MYLLLARLMFLVTLFMLVLSPFITLLSRRGTSYFLVLWMMLYINQMFMYEIGSDVSPYAFVYSQIHAIRFAGLTLSALSSVSLGLFVVLEVCFRNIRASMRTLAAVYLVSVILFIGLIRGESIRGEIDSFLKILLPFLMCMYIEWDVERANVDTYRNVITAIDLIVVVQVALCKVLTGSFAAYNYYHEMAEEYFGFFNHPHVFAGLLSILCIWNVYSIQMRKLVKLNVSLLVVSMLLLFVTGVRTYPVALACGLVYLGVMAFGSSRLRNVRWLFYVGVIVAIVFGSYLLRKFGSGRVVGDLSSGRLERWSFDLRYFSERYSLPEKVFGRGIGSVEAVNAEIFGVSINSLNLWIDMLLDYGVLGMIAMTFAYAQLFVASWEHSGGLFQNCIVITFVATCLINSVVSYVAIMSMMVTILFIIRTEGATSDESVSVELASIPRGAGEQRMVGTGVY